MKIENIGYSYEPNSNQIITGRIGAEIAGFKLSLTLDQDTVYEISLALVKYKTIFFKNQQHLTDDEQEGFAALLGKPFNHPTVLVKSGTAHVLELDLLGDRADTGHTDITFIEDYPKATILRSIVAPLAGGDTVWANTTSAYNDLPAELKILADSLRAVHSNDYDYASKVTTNTRIDAEKYLELFNSTEYETEHPLVRVHPESGEKTLLLGHFFKRFVGYSNQDSRRLFELFQDYAVNLENVVRWRWSVGDVAIWDNRATQHRAINDYGDDLRVVRCVTIEGGIPGGC
ncbi:TauD/TfdA family dioxygenase [Acinetobacter sp. ANC 4779]|uniref:TauD/TfdA dioxygenase family protein n=1 Tax=Acinetobacter sp. ANC 4779 TaxID=2529848 RepID=UPI002B05D184|nr:TauD/TfdA family dioxygenase [Acinetobacter sp. ANC 4779]